MTRVGVALIVIVSVVVLQASVLPVHITSSFKPDLLLIIVVYLALRGSFQTGAPLSWGLGIIKDVFSGLYLGLNAFSFLLIFLVIKNISDRLYTESAPLFVITASVATLSCVAINLLLLVMFTASPGIAYSMGIGLLPHLLVNAFVASLVPLIPGFDRPLETP
ncbi:rod shape-determining protein MreD [Oryzomonas japonica]|uniref:Rod shape-determining protein MreD n=1 Tax=Oryzomonas japonica TaxID=2603858 RepID=A0A7J4ZPK6_9BACT|nr:rod shape-determining protein MreD [Oryzomonas japonica]KAB0664810.1 rod shape-determining protein MreD [Oryzomonas japonica]